LADLIKDIRIAAPDRALSAFFDPPFAFILVARRVGIPKIRSLISHSRLNSHAARARAQHGAARVLKLKWKWRNNQRRNAAQFQFACVARAR
jgi:hypothetical protein